MTRIDSETKHESRLLFPGLQSFYDVAVPLAWPIVRIAVGWNLVVHGWGKVTRGPSAYVRAFVEQGFDPALPWIWSALMIEFVGGIALIVGLFTRFFAAAAAVEMLVITLLYWKAGFSWLNRGYEYTLLWGPRLLRHRAAGRGTLFARSPHRGGALSNQSGPRGFGRARATSSVCSLPRKRGRGSAEMLYHIAGPLPGPPAEVGCFRLRPFNRVTELG